jgi:hypothetical protein
VRFSGDLWFDFDSVECWRVFLLLDRAAGDEGVDVDLTWLGLDPSWDGGDAPLRGGLRALAMHAAVHDGPRQRTLRSALFTLRHRQGDAFDDDLSLLAAARVAGLDGPVMLQAIETTGAAQLRRHRQTASTMGIVGVPTLVRDGPPLAIATTPAVEEGPARARLEVIDRMLDDDGLWRLAKP